MQVRQNDRLALSRSGLALNIVSWLKSGLHLCSVRPTIFHVIYQTPVRVFDMASKTIHTSLLIRGYCFSALISHESNSILKIIRCWNFVVVRSKSCGSEDAESFAANNISHFHSPKTGKEESKLMQ